jgi:hypothetical protein
MKSQDETNLRLKAIMAERGMTRSAAARLCMVRDPSLDRWLAPRQRREGRKLVDNPQYRRMPEHRLALMEHALELPLDVEGALAMASEQNEAHKRFMAGITK